MTLMEAKAKAMCKTIHENLEKAFGFDIPQDIKDAYEKEKIERFKVLEDWINRG